MHDDKKINPEISQKLALLEKKYESMGQDMLSYLEGLLYSDFITYWDYINLDVLLNLQQPRTAFPDEEIFIVYHQISELYFKLIVKAILQIQSDPLNLDLFERQIKRCNSYLDALISSFSIMKDGMDKEEFRSFRMALLPASGFQSFQYRQIEFLATNIENLCQQNSSKYGYDSLYWKSGGIELSSGKPTLTLKQFEHKYFNQIEELIEKGKEQSLNSMIEKIGIQNLPTSLIEALRLFDLQLEVNWPLMHYRSAVRYLKEDPVEIAATGGTNWMEYLPPKFQRVQLFPKLWSSEEIKQWGKNKQ